MRNIPNLNILKAFKGTFPASNKLTRSGRGGRGRDGRL